LYDNHEFINMIYLPESYHFQDTPDFPNLKAIQVTAQEIGKSCKYFYASNLSPINKSVATDKFGELPEDSEKKTEFVNQVIVNLWNESYHVFRLYLDYNPIDFKNGSDYKFAMHEHVSGWSLNIPDPVFGMLQDAWEKTGLPKDLFYPQHLAIHTPYPGSSIWARISRKFGAEKIYTPLQWDHRIDN